MACNRNQSGCNEKRNNGGRCGCIYCGAWNNCVNHNSGYNNCGYHNCGYHNCGWNGCAYNGCGYSQCGTWGGCGCWNNGNRYNCTATALTAEAAAENSCDSYNICSCEESVSQ